MGDVNMNSTTDCFFDDKKCNILFDPLNYYTGPVTNTLLFITIRDKSVEKICNDLSKIALDDQSSRMK